MRDFETDFDFDADDYAKELRAFGTSDMRIDEHKTVTRDPNRTGDPEHDMRLAAHTERIRSALGIK